MHVRRIGSQVHVHTVVWPQAELLQAVAVLGGVNITHLSSNCTLLAAGEVRWGGMGCGVVGAWGVAVLTMMQPLRHQSVRPVAAWCWQCRWWVRVVVDAWR